MNTLAICAMIGLFCGWLVYVTAVDRVLSWILRRWKL